MKKLLSSVLLLCATSVAYAQTYSSTAAVSVPSDIDCPGSGAGGALSPISVSSTGTISTPGAVTINMNLSSGCLATVRIVLYAPSGDSCILINMPGRIGDCAATFCDVLSSSNTLSFNSGYTTTITPTGGVVPSGNYAPSGSTYYPAVGSLSTFLTGQPVNGTWNLKGYSDAGLSLSIDSWSIDFGPTALPLNLLSFSGQAFDRYNHIRWRTGSERDVQSFELQSSVSGSFFRAVASVPAIGSGDQAYELKDERLAGEETFYRLKMVDKSGAYAYSKVLSLKSDPSAFAAIRISPNPVKDQLTILLNNTDLVGSSVGIYSVSGQLMETISLGSSVHKHSISGYPAGMYVLKTDDGSVFRFTKQD